MLTVAVAVLAEGQRTLLPATAALVPEQDVGGVGGTGNTGGTGGIATGGSADARGGDANGGNGGRGGHGGRGGDGGDSEGRGRRRHRWFRRGRWDGHRPASATRMPMVAPVVPVVTDPSPRVAMAATVPQVVPVVPVATAEVGRCRRDGYRVRSSATFTP